MRSGGVRTTRALAVLGLSAILIATVELRRTPGNHDNVWAEAQLPAVAQFLAAGWKSG